MARPLSLALVQMDSELGNLERNLARVIEFVQQASAQGAQVVVFPELILTGYHQELLGARLTELALTREDEPIQALARAAHACGVYVLAGFLERRDSSGAIHDSLVLCAPNGKVVDTYSKSHIFASERRHFTCGNDLPVYETEFGKLGLMICYELCFPEVARILGFQPLWFSDSVAWCGVRNDAAVVINQYENEKCLLKFVWPVRAPRSAPTIIS